MSFYNTRAFLFRAGKVSDKFAILKVYNNKLLSDDKVYRKRDIETLDRSIQSNKSLTSNYFYFWFAEVFCQY